MKLDKILNIIFNKKKFYKDNILDMNQYINNKHLILEEKFYEKHVKGKEEKLKKKLGFRIVSIKKCAEFDFLHTSSIENKSTSKA